MGFKSCVLRIKTNIKASLTILSPVLIASTLLLTPAFMPELAKASAALQCKSLFSGGRKVSRLDLPVWLSRETDLSLTHIFNNISPSDALPGAVVAAQTRHNPNYYYHWVRDAGLVIDSLVTTYEQGTHPELNTVIRKKINEYVNFSERIQQTDALAGLGEPKFEVDGTPFQGPWGRPQNDSPALRALSLIHWAKVLQREGQTLQLKRLYDATMPANSLIKRDLEYISHQWRDSSFDLWEEVRGDHFYTRMVQRRALIEGAHLAEQLNDARAAQWYLQQAGEIEKDLQTYWDADRGYFVETHSGLRGIADKPSNLDTAVVLGLLHGSLNDGFLSFSDPRVLSTLQKLESTFRQIYAVNSDPAAPGVAIGRYPEDKYGGANFEGGNPWPLCTLALAEAYYRAAHELSLRGQGAKAQELVRKGDQFVARVQYHAPADGALNEQIDRNTGYMTSVSDLTWNYAAILTSSLARSQALRK